MHSTNYITRIRTSWAALQNNRFSVDVLWNMGSMVILAVGGVVLNSLILAVRGPAALGIFNQVYAVYTILSQLGVGGIQFSTLKHIAYVQDDPRHCADIAVAALTLVLILSIGTAGIGYVLTPLVGQWLHSEAVQTGLILTLPGLFFFALNKVLINILNGMQWMRAYAVFRTLRFLLLPGFVVLLVVLGVSDATLALSLTLTEGVLCIVLAVYIYLVPGVLPLARPRAFGQHVRMHLSYGLRGALTGVLVEMNTRVDILLLGRVSSETLVGLYSFAAIMAEGFAQLPISIRYNVDPRLGQYFARDERPAITAFAKQIRRVFLPVMLLLGILSGLAYPVAFWLLSGKSGLMLSWGAFAILILGHMLTAGYTPFNGILLLGGLPGWQSGLMLFTILTNIALNTALIPLLSLHGAALATTVTLLASTILLVVLARRLLNVRL